MKTFYIKKFTDLKKFFIFLSCVKCDQTQDDGKYVSTVSVTKYYSLDTTASNYVSQVHNETIYWDWAYETKDKNDSSSEGDELDKEDSKNDAKLKITATATQVTNIPVGKLSSKVKIGDYVDYNPGNYKIEPSELDDLSGVTLSETVRTANNDSIKVASTENVKVAALTSSTKWKVLDIDGDVVKIIPMDVTGAEVTVWGKGGYINCIEAFNRIAAIYGNGFGATGARCITVEDINKLEGYTPGTNSYVGTYSKSSYGPYVLEDENGNIYEVDDNVEIGYSPTTKTKSTNLNYEYRFNKFDKIYPKQSSFWLASRCITLYNVAVSFNIRCVAFTQRVTYTYNNYYLQSNTGAANLDTKNILPVVTLKAGILTPGKGEDGAWQLM